MAGRVDNIDPSLFPLNGRRLGKDRDPSFFLKIAGIHQPLDNLLVVTEHAALFHDRVDQGSFPVINVRDNRDIPDIPCHVFKIRS